MTISPRILITGITSIHGWPLYRALKERLPENALYGLRSPKSLSPSGHNIAAACITDTIALSAIYEQFKPTHIIHAAGVCDLDVCEERPQWARILNVLGTKRLLDVFGTTARFIYISTDLVFSGNNPPDGGYCEDNSVDPVSIAGITFAEAEDIVIKHDKACIVRLGLPIGRSITGTKGALDFIEGRLKRGVKTSLFYDEIRSCISCKIIGDILWRLINNDATGIYNLGGDKSVSLYDIGRYVAKLGNYNENLLTSLARFEEKNGPPRIGNVTLNSSKIKKTLGIESISNGMD